MGEEKIERIAKQQEKAILIQEMMLNTKCNYF